MEVYSYLPFGEGDLGITPVVFGGLFLACALVGLSPGVLWYYAVMKTASSFLHTKHACAQPTENSLARAPQCVGVLRRVCLCGHLCYVLPKEKREMA